MVKGREARKETCNREMEQQLANIQGQMEDSSVLKDDSQWEAEAFKSFHSLLRQEEDYWRLKSQSTWL